MSFKYQFFCCNCGYKRFSNGNDIKDLIEVVRSPIFAGVPKFDKEKKEIVVPKLIKTRKQFKCPGCGFLIKADKLIQKEENEQTNRDHGREAGFEGPPIS